MFSVVSWVFFLLSESYEAMASNPAKPSPHFSWDTIPVTPPQLPPSTHQFYHHNRNLFRPYQHRHHHRRTTTTRSLSMAPTRLVSTMQAR